MKVFQVFFLVLAISFSAYGQNMGPVPKVAIGQIDLSTYDWRATFVICTRLLGKAG